MLGKPGNPIALEARGLKKARRPPLVQAKTALLLRAFDGRVRELLEGADVVSEGQVRVEAGGRVWYGSTSIAIALHTLSTGQQQTVLAVFERDLHLRVRVLRFALREACLRAPSSLGSMSCEVHFAPNSGSLRIDVDVQAPLIESRRRRRAP